MVYGLDKLDKKFSIENASVKEEMEAMQFSLEYVLQAPFTVDDFYIYWLCILELVHQTPFLEIELNKLVSWSKQQVHKLSLGSHTMLRSV